MIRKEHLSIIFTAVGCIGTVVTAVMAAHETPKAIKIVDDHRLQIDETGETDLALGEKIVDYAKGYWKTGVCAAVTIAADIASCASGIKAYKALVAVSGSAIAIGSKYKDKLHEIIGEEKAKLIDKEIAKEVKSDSFSNEKVWFYEPVSEQFFQSTWREMYESEYEANKQLNVGKGYIEVGDVFPQIRKLAPKSSNWAWDVDRTCEAYGYPWIDFSHEPKNRPAVEDGGIDWHFNDGRETYIIHYGAWPEPPEHILTANC